MFHPQRFISAATLMLLLGSSVVASESSSGAILDTAAPDEAPLKYELDVLPVLTSADCNSGGCHGKSRGQNGFALSLLGFDADFDYSAIVLEGRGRRVFPGAPDNSLLLQKASGLLPHGGGVRLPVGSPEYEVVRKWIAAGMPRVSAQDPTLTKIELSPQPRVMQSGEKVPLTVTATYSDGSVRDVTALTDYQSSEAPVVGVDDDGIITAGALPGEATIMARYMGLIATWSTAIPLAGEVNESFYASLPKKNFIDGLIWEKLAKLKLTPSELCSDSTFLRRAYLDAIGRLPTPLEARSFLENPAADKRDRLVDSLLERDEFADFWANKWADLLRPNPYRVGIKATLNYDAWIRDAFRQNMPYDQFVQELVTASGSTWRNGATTFFRDRREPDEIATMVSQLFLGIRLECAKCHQHPFEKWGQEDFYSFAAYFSRIGRKGTGLSPPISGSEEFVFGSGKGSVSHPLTGKVLPPRPLFGSAPEIAEGEDPRVSLAKWMISPENDYFVQVAVNRVWADLMGRGIVDPVDDLRATNPPTNGPLLDALADHFREQKFDLKTLIRTIMTSHAYGLSSEANANNISDTRNHSRYLRQRLRGEVLFDAVLDVTGQTHSFTAMPPGSRAIELWTYRIESQFLDAFGRPNENQDPPCERTSDPTVVQALHLMNAPSLHEKVIAEGGRAAELAKSNRPAEELADEIYLLLYSRFPTDDERRVVSNLIGPPPGDRTAVIQDLMWAMINTPEFIFKN